MPPTRTSQPSWRDVLEISKEMRADLAAHRQESREDHDKMNARLSELEATHQFGNGQKAGERRVFGMAKSTIALVVSTGAGLAAIYANLHH